MLPAEAAALLSSIDIGGIEAIERIKHGLTNDSWLVNTRQGAFVVRHSNTSGQSLQIDRQSEAVILDAVARIGLGPEIVVNDLTRHVLITRYAGETWTTQQPSEPLNIDRLALLLQHLHRTPVPDGAKRVELLGVTEGYLRTLDAHGAAPAVMQPTLRKRAIEVASTLQQQSSNCLCHNDVHSLNIVDNGTLRLIDWEYAGQGERFFDLASVCIYHAYEREQRERLLLGYAGNFDTQTWHRLELCCWLFDYIRELWMEVREIGDQ